jgi:hypothetical protein
VGWPRLRRAPVKRILSEAEKNRREPRRRRTDSPGEGDVFDKVVRRGESRDVHFVQWDTADDIRSRIVEVLVEELKRPDGTQALAASDDSPGFDATLGGEAGNEMRFSSVNGEIGVAVGYFWRRANRTFRETRGGVLVPAWIQVGLQ